MAGDPLYGTGYTFHRPWEEFMMFVDIRIETSVARR